MNILTKFILIILSSLCLFFLVYFTFLSSDTNQLKNEYTYIQEGVYTINNNDGKYNVVEGESNNKNSLQFKNISIGNNIFYKAGEVTINDNTITLSPGVYYFDINSLIFDYTININGSEIKVIGPGSFVINNEEKNRKNMVLSMSGKLELSLSYDFEDKSSDEYKPALVNLYPQMFISFSPRGNRNARNGDLLRIQQVHNLYMFEGDIYTKSNDETEEYNLNAIVKDGFFEKNEDHYSFIKDVQNYKKQNVQKLVNNFQLLKKNDFYTIPGESYILKYYSYFVNEEKKKTYLKNLILKDIITLVHEKQSTNTNTQNNLIKNIDKQLNELETVSVSDYEKMIDVINHYYENIIISQNSNIPLLMNITQLYYQIHNQEYTFKNPSLISLHSIYENIQYGNNSQFYIYVNNFVVQHEKEMGISIYDENNKIHGYFLYYLRNILSTEVKQVENINDLLIMLELYINIVNIYAEKGTTTTQKTILYDNINILKTFVNTLQNTHIQENRNDKGLVELKTPYSIQEADYNLLKDNIQSIINIFDKYKRLINNSNAQKDKSILKEYTEYISLFGEYTFAIDDYSGYEIENGYSVVIEPEEQEEIQKEDILSFEKIETYLQKFSGVDSSNTEISIRDYEYCIGPDFITEAQIIKEEDGYCYEIKNLFIDGFLFNFIITPSKGNTISYLTYIDDEDKLIEKEKFIIFELDKLEESLGEKIKSAQISEKYKYDFSRFFLNRFIQTEVTNNSNNNTITDNTPEFRDPTGKGIQTAGTNRIKSELLNSQNSPLVQIRSTILVVFNSLVFTNNNGKDKLEVYPSDFKVRITDGNITNDFTGKFEGEYDFESDPHSFNEGKIYIKNNISSAKNKYLLDGKFIGIENSFDVVDTKLVFDDALYDFKKIEYLYDEIKNKFSEQQIEEIKISFNSENKRTTFSLPENIKIIFSKDENIDIVKNERSINKGFYRNINTYLNNL